MCVCVCIVGGEEKKKETYNLMGCLVLSSMDCAKRASTNLFQEVIFVVGSPLTCHVIKVNEKKSEREKEDLSSDTRLSLHCALLTFLRPFL